MSKGRQPTRSLKIEDNGIESTSRDVQSDEVRWSDKVGRGRGPREQDERIASSRREAGAEGSTSPKGETVQTDPS